MERAKKAAFSGWRYRWWGEGGEAAGIPPEGRAVPDTDRQQGLEGQGSFGALTFTEPPDADPHVRWCERGRLAAAPYSIVVTALPGQRA